jgi:hypothetical protein
VTRRAADRIRPTCITSYLPAEQRVEAVLNDRLSNFYQDQRFVSHNVASSMKLQFPIVSFLVWCSLGKAVAVEKSPTHNNIYRNPTPVVAERNRLRV